MNMFVSNLHRCTLLLLISFISIYARTLFAQNTYTDFVGCVSATSSAFWGTTCTLPNQAFTVSKPIVVGRSPLTIQGAGSSSTLRRAPQAATALNYYSLLSVGDVGQSGTPSTISIRNLTFDGNRNNQCAIGSGGIATCISFPSVGIPVSPRGSNGDVVANLAANFSDISIAPSSQAVSVAINNVTMVNSPGYSILIERGIQNVNAVMISNSNLGSISTGQGCAYLSCVLVWTGAAPAYGTVIQSSYLYGAGGGAIAYVNATEAKILNNQFFDNMREAPWCPYAGGQIYVAKDSSRVTIFNNVLNGNSNRFSSCGDKSTPGAGGSTGLEIEGKNHLIETNFIEYHVQSGISLEGVQCARLLSNQITQGGGDQVWPVKGMISVVSNPGFPTSSDIRLDGNYVVTNSSPGLFVWSGGNGALRVDYAANLNGAGYFYSNAGGNLYPGSVASSSWNPGNCTIPAQL